MRSVIKEEAYATPWATQNGPQGKYAGPTNISGKQGIIYDKFTL